MRLPKKICLAALVLPVVSTLAAEPSWLTTKDAKCPLFRKEFTLSAAPKKATLRIVGLGHYQLQINGQHVGDAVISQAWSQYNKTIYFDEIDVTPLLQKGGNAIGVMLGNSFWYNQPTPKRLFKGRTETKFGTQFLLYVDLDIQSADGQSTKIVSDETWHTAPGPVTVSGIYGGEDYDARLEQPGWDRAGFDEKSWSAPVVTTAPDGRLEKQFCPPLREQKIYPAKEITQDRPNLFHAFFEQNASAILRFTANGQAGQMFTITVSDYRAEDGKFMKPNWGGPKFFRYTCKGGGPETHQWMFDYEGFRGIEVEGAVAEGQDNPKRFPVISHIEMVHTRLDIPEVGSFHTSSSLYNNIHQLVDWAIRSNTSFVLTDCPHREKLGWLECSHLLAPSFSYRFDCRDWFAKIIHDIRDAQEPSGQIYTVAPTYYGGKSAALRWTIEWGAAGVLLPWHHYVWYGDPAILHDNYDCMHRFVDHVASTSTDFIAIAGLGDWYDYGHGQPPGPSRFTPQDLTATAVQIMCIDAVMGAAKVLDRADDVKRYQTLRDQTAAAYLKKFYDQEHHVFANHGSCQCGNTISIMANVVPEADKPAVIEAVIKDLESRDWQQTPGDIGHVFFIRALAQAGRSDVLHRIYSREGVGSYGGILKKGMTSLPETWDAMNNGLQSLNHCMLGHVMEWYYGYVAGIRQQPGSVGWKKVLIAPVPGALTSVNASFNSPTGKIVSKWTVADGKFRLDAEVPPGADGRIILPDGTAQEVTAGKHILECGWPPAGH